MSVLYRALACALVAGLPAPAFSQYAMVVGYPTAANILRQGTPVRLRTVSELSSKEHKVGYRFDLEVVDDVLLNGRVIIPQGSPATGEISYIKRKGMWGKSGRIEARLLTVRANGRDIAIRGTIGDKGETGTAGVVASVLWLPVAGFFVTGTSAVLPPGMPATGVTNFDMPIVFADDQLVAMNQGVAQPIAVRADAPAMVPAGGPVAR